VTSYLCARKRNLAPETGLDTEWAVIANGVLAVGEDTEKGNLGVLLKRNCAVGVVLKHIRAKNGAHLRFPATAYVNGHATVRRMAIVCYIRIPHSLEVGLSQP